MPIRFYEGVEGSGKTCMMTKDLYSHHLAGGTVFAFPGYELYGFLKETGEKVTLSQALLPEQWVTLPEELRHQKIAIAIDEVQNYFNHHTWYNKINDMMTTLMAQRRKFEVAILMTGPIFDIIPPDLRHMIHEVIHCTDNHTLNHAITRGAKCIYRHEDRRGLLSNPMRNWSRKRVFPMKSWYPHYDTYAAVDAIHQFIRLKFEGREIIIGADGGIKSTGYGAFDPEYADKLLSQNQPKPDKRISVAKAAIDYLKKKSNTFVHKEVLAGIMHIDITEFVGRNSYGSVLSKLGAIYDGNRDCYDLSGCDLIN